jgi:uncharacterized protein (TIGR02246 family)
MIMAFGRLAIVALACTALSGCATPRRAEPEIREFVARFVRSVNEANVDEFVACFSEDATAFFPSAANASKRTGRSAIRAAVTPTFAQGAPKDPVTPRELTISLDRDLAYVTFDGGTGTTHLRRTLVLRRVDGAWTIAHLHASNVSENAR